MRGSDPVRDSEIDGQGVSAGDLLQVSAGIAGLAIAVAALLPEKLLGPRIVLEPFLKDIYLVPTGLLVGGLLSLSAGVEILRLLTLSAQGTRRHVLGFLLASVAVLAVMFVVVLAARES